MKKTEQETVKYKNKDKEKGIEYKTEKGNTQIDKKKTCQNFKIIKIC